MSQENVEIVRRCVEAFRDRDIDALAELWDETDGEFRSLFATAERDHRARGREGVVAYINDIDATFVEWNPEDEELIDAGADRIVLVFRMVAVGRGSGVRMDHRMAIVFTLRGGKLLLGEPYLEPSEALNAAGLSE